ncbi:WD40-repeat-containing domain protein [Gamsiella multidivaricata]|uniref:WD40-repeat-containing domain protein n=1 Tax=Gamsiella multidivaricata TaxID=101098 RepID=UPI00221ECF76|nr:WD40-repeat-containing domain protein [Gamsiella multidivaricata]KAI7815890.1 WD40-repeat-containing domain protein [Gamsiella multidivaricata]
MSSSNVAGHQSSSQQVDPAVEKLVRETKSLKAKIDLLEAENKALKKSLYELSYIYSAYIGKAQHNGQQNRSSNSNNNSNSAATDDDTDNIVGTSSYRHDDDAHSDMALAVGQLLSSMSVTQQKQGAEAGTPNTASGSDPSSRDLDAKLKSAADLIKVEEEGVRRLNMGSIVSRQDGASKSDGRQFFLKNDLKGHQGAVYAVQYSPNGKFLATGSFDKTVRIWDGTTNQNELYVLKGHGLNISDLAWGHDSSLLLSAAYDKTCKLWDVESGNLLDSFEGEGFVQCVRFHPHDNSIFFNGTTRNMLSMIDTRKDSSAPSGPPITIKNDAMVNSIYVYHDGLTVISGDSSGYLKTWDMRMGRVLQSILNEPTKSPISHIAVSKQRGSIEETNIADTEEQESRWLAVNSYDNVIRVYDRGFEPPTTVPRLIHSLKGYRNKHWPIKSAFFHGKEYIAGAATRRSGKVRGADGDEPQSILSDKDIPLESSLILASGSMDPYVYLFDVGAGDGQYDLLQKLSGHTDRVYDVDFHPIDHVLASGSADFSVKVWGRASKRKK